MKHEEQTGTLEPPDVLAHEAAVFQRRHQELQEKYAGQYVAIRGDDVVDHDHDLTVLGQRVYQRFGNVPLWIALVREQPVEQWTFRSPRFT